METMRRLFCMRIIKGNGSVQESVADIQGLKFCVMYFANCNWRIN